MEPMNDEPEELPDASNRAGGESDVVAERSGATTPMAPRPIPADPPDAQDEPERDEEPQKEEPAADEDTEEESSDSEPTG